MTLLTRYQADPGHPDSRALLVVAIMSNVRAFGSSGARMRRAVTQADGKAARHAPPANMCLSCQLCARSADPPASVCRVAASADVASSSSGHSEALSVPSANIWELDFCSRPLLDVRGKKVWELLVCDQQGEWVYSKYFPNNRINSTELKAALKEILAVDGAQKPEKVLFFRGQMQTIISRALQDMDIRPVPSRRCFALFSLLEERIKSVYKRDERYSSTAGTMFQLELAPPAEIADALRGEQWAFVQLPLSALQQEMKPLESKTMFGAFLPNLSKLSLSDDTMIPGVAVFSRRAGPLAAWTNSLQLACLKADIDRSCLLLETGVRDRYKYGAWRRSQAATEEAEAWEKAKVESNGLHFLAVQTDPDADSCTGIWMLRDQAPPSV